MYIHNIFKYMKNLHCFANTCRWGAESAGWENEGQESNDLDYR